MKWISILFPPTCPGCDHVLTWSEREEGFCHDCRSRITLAQEPVCKQCGKPLVDVKQDRCLDCQEKKHLFRQAKALYVYDGPMKEAMYRLKNSRRLAYGQFFGQQMAERYSLYLRRVGVNLILAVPLHAAKERERGYNQSLYLAQSLARQLKIPLAKKLLLRVRKTREQKSLSQEARQRNLYGAFALREEGISLREKRILLVDDIYTTGSTCDAVSQVLLQAGAEEVYVLCVCVGQGDA